MRQDNPMLAQLQAEYKANPHFAALADEVSQDILDCSFEEAMNIYPEAEDQALQLLGSAMRPVCNAIFKTYSEPPAKPFDPAMFARADRETKRYQGQVQGFAYPQEGSVRHVVRDLLLPPGSQEVASFLEDLSVCEESQKACEGEYLRCHTLAMRAIQERQVSMIWAHYMWGTTSGHFARVEEEA